MPERGRLTLTGRVSLLCRSAVQPSRGSLLARIEPRCRLMHPLPHTRADRPFGPTSGRPGLWPEPGKGGTTVTDTWWFSGLASPFIRLHNAQNVRSERCRCRPGVFLWAEVGLALRTSDGRHGRIHYTDAPLHCSGITHKASDRSCPDCGRSRGICGPCVDNASFGRTPCSCKRSTRGCKPPGESEGIRAISRSRAASGPGGTSTARRLIPTIRRTARTSAMSAPWPTTRA